MPLHHVLAGQYNRRVIIQKTAVGSDSEGSPKTIWAVVDTVWAKVEALTAQERVAAAQAQLDVTDSVTIRWRPDLVQAQIHNMRLLYGDRVLEIHDVISDEARHVDLQFLCLEMII